MLGRQDLPQLHLDLHRIFEVIHKAEEIRNADAVRVHDRGAGDLEHVAEDEVRGLAPDAGQSRQLLHRARQLPAVFLQQHIRAGNDVPRLGMIEAAGAHILLNFRDVCLGKGLKRREARKQRRCYLIHPLIGALRRKAHREQQLISFVPIERAVRQWVLRHQQTHYLIYLLLRSHLLSSIVPPHSMTGSSTLL